MAYNFTAINQLYYETPTQNLLNIWTECGHFCQTKWEQFLNIVGEDEFDLWVIYTSIYSVLIYWLLGSVYMFIDIKLKFRRFKVQPGTNEPVNSRRYIKAISLVLFNQIVVSPLMIYSGFYVGKSLIPTARTLPTLKWIAFEMMVLTLVREFTFYYSHRLLHTRYLYKTIHKMHHSWTAPLAITAAYCHPIEHIFSNVLPIGLGIGILQSHILINWIWIFYCSLQTLTAHSGYHFPFLMSPEAHDFHHEKFNNCFGLIGLLDRLHGTDVEFRKTAAFDRHTFLLSSKTAREVYPDYKNT